MAADYNHLDVVKELLDRGANKDALDNDLKKVLNRAIEEHHDRGADKELQGEAERTAEDQQGAIDDIKMRLMRSGSSQSLVLLE